MRKREVQSSAAQICSRMQRGVRKRRKWSWARMKNRGAGCGATVGPRK